MARLPSCFCACVCVRALRVRGVCACVLAFIVRAPWCMSIIVRAQVASKYQPSAWTAGRAVCAGFGMDEFAGVDIDEAAAAIDGE